MAAWVSSSGEMRVIDRIAARIVISRDPSRRPSVFLGVGTVVGDANPRSRRRTPWIFSFSGTLTHAPGFLASRPVGAAPRDIADIASEIRGSRARRMRTRRPVAQTAFLWRDSRDPPIVAAPRLLGPLPSQPRVLRPGINYSTGSRAADRRRTVILPPRLPFSCRSSCLPGSRLTGALKRIRHR